MILDGRALAGEVLARTKARAKRLPRQPKVVAYVAHDPTPATKSYLAIKQKKSSEAGCLFAVRHIKSSPRSLGTFDMIVSAMRESDADAIVVQLPVPEGIDAQAVCDAIPIEKDADVLSKAARERFERGDADALLPPVVAAIAEIFTTYNVEPKGKRAVVIGEGFLVGQPAAAWLRQKRATVSTVTDSVHLRQHLKEADIIISGAGSAHIIKPDMLKRGVVLVDAGTSESSGIIVGDADPACAEVCSLFTPVPGGVGPLAVACLFANAVTLACLRRQAERAMRIGDSSEDLLRRCKI